MLFNVLMFEALFTNLTKPELRQQGKSFNLGVDISFKGVTLDLDISNCRGTFFVGLIS